jgi:CubicO group peptidase (beta-lactamase class C family)
LVTVSPARAATVSEQLDAALQSSWEQTDSPGVQAAVLRDGQLVWQGALGEAVVGSRPVTNQTLFEFGSFSKMMSAAFTLHRVETGRLKLDVPIRTYIGRSVPGAGRVTLRMLLSHTAGYPDVYERPPVSELLGPKYDPNRRWTFKTVFKSLGPPSHPGRQFAYSNSGYIVLAYLLVKTTNRPLAEAFQDFLEPAGLVEPISESSLTMRRTAQAAGIFAHAYFGGQDQFTGAKTIPTDFYGLPWGDGLYAGTALGGSEFLDALLVGNRLLPPRSVDQMVATTRQSHATGGSDVGEGRYGFGTYRLNEAGRTWQGHDGSYIGFSTMGFTDRKDGVTIFVNANGHSFGPQPANPIWHALAKAYVAAALG